MGFGEVKGKTTTNSINHCSDCGHEWKKYESNYKLGDDFKKELIESIDYYHKGYKFKSKDYLEKLKDKFYAETIFNVNKELFYSRKIENLKIKFLRKYLKSVYDVK